MTVKQQHFGGRPIETDGAFFDNMREAERRIIAEIDPEGLADLDREEKELAAMTDDDEDSAGEKTAKK